MTDEQNTGWTGGHNAFGDFAPGMVHYTDSVLFDQVWERPELSKRDRSLITVAALTAIGKTHQLQFHFGFARQNGVRRRAEGSPAALGVLFRGAQRHGRHHFAQEHHREERLRCCGPHSRQQRPLHRSSRSKRIEGNIMSTKHFDQVFPLGEPNDAYAQYFTGQSYLALLTSGSVPVSNVTFEPCCRNNWHIHRGKNGGGDQILLCTAGSGWYQADGEDPVSMEPGSVIRVPAGTKHWHGAKADSWFSHVAFITPGEDVSNEWLEPVTDEAYGQLPKNGENA